MKRLTVLLVLLLVMGLANGTAEEAAVIEIRDIAGLKDVVNHPGAHFRLMNDIDLKGEDWTPIPFSGELDGGGFGIYNLTVTRTGGEVRTTHDGNMKAYETTFAGLFSVAEYADVHDLKVIGAYVTIEGETHCFAAIVAGFIDHSDFTNVAVDGRVRLNNYAVMAGVGGLAGFGCGAVNGCSARVELIFEDRNFTSKCEQFMGAIVACGITRILDCTVEIDGYDSCHGYVHNGGLMGMYYHCGYRNYLREGRRTVIRNSITGRIYFFEDNRDRRAYCRGDVGERLTKITYLHTNNVRNFERKETKEYGTVLLPENCGNPEYEIRIIPAADGEWGWTEHICSTCGYTWRDDYTAP